MARHFGHMHMNTEYFWLYEFDQTWRHMLLLITSKSALSCAKDFYTFIVASDFITPDIF